MDHNLFRKEAIEHRRERLWGDVIIMQPLSFALLTLVITIIAGLLIGLLLWGNYARKETVNGYLVPDEGLAKVYAKSTGVVSHTFVQEGQFVESGSQLLTVSTGRATENTSDIDAVIISELSKSQSSIETKIEEEQRLSQVEVQKLKARITGITAEITQLKKQFISVEEKYAITKKQVDNFRELQKKGHLSDKQYVEKYHQHLENQISYNEVERQLTIKKNQLTEANFELEQLPLRLAIRMTDLSKAVSDVKQRRLNIEGQRTFTLHAPTSGKITALQAHPGKSVKNNMPVLAILPEGAKFQAQLFVPTRAIGFVRKGQKVMIRYSAFPYQRYGLYQGAIAKVAEVILTPEELPVPVSLDEPVYRVTVALDAQHVKAYGRKLPLQSGMLLEADIILESLSLMDWLLDPLYSLKGRL